MLGGYTTNSVCATSNSSNLIRPPENYTNSDLDHSAAYNNFSPSIHPYQFLSCRITDTVSLFYPLWLANLPMIPDLEKVTHIPCRNWFRHLWMSPVLCGLLYSQRQYIVNWANHTNTNIMPLFHISCDWNIVEAGIGAVAAFVLLAPCKAWCRGPYSLFLPVYYATISLLSNRTTTSY